MNITKKHGFYYLQYSYKKDGKTKSKEKYLGKELPLNIEQIKEEFMRQILGKTLFKKFDKIKENYDKEWKKFPESIKKDLRQELTIKFTYNTNAIEGSTITKDETEDIIKRKIAPHKPLADIQETKNHAKIFYDIIESKYEDLSLPLLLKWHEEMFNESKPDIAGKIRDYLVKVGDYICPNWQDLPELLKEFFQWYNANKTKMHPVELAAKAHFKFVKIHPFGDGNGRISRLIMNFILFKYEYPMMIIEYKKRRSYYRALNKSDKKKSDWEFVKYFYRRYLGYYKKYIK